MNAFTIITGLILYGLTFICFFFPFKKGQRQTGYIVGVALGFIITWTLLGNLEFLVIFIWPLIFMFQIVFISYWSFIALNKKRIGQVLALILSVGFLLLIIQPWISDWIFSKKDAAKILSFHNLELQDDFRIVKNEAGGFRDYYETFTLQLSDNDFNRITETIRNSKNYKGLVIDYSTIRSLDFKINDTLDFETVSHFERVYWSNRKMDNGTSHFRIQLDKETKELSYTGSIE